MKRNLILFMLAVSTHFVNAQDIKKAQTALLLNQVENAKAETDKLVADPKNQNKAEVFLLHAKACSLIFKDEKLKAKNPNIFKTADEAYRKYIKLDPTLKLVKDNNTYNDYIPNMYSDIYRDYFNQAIATYNNKKWDSAAYYFSQSVDYSNFLVSNKWIVNDKFAFDTTAIMYGGNAYKNAGKNKEAFAMYKILADKKISDPSYADMYKNFLLLLTEMKDNENFNKYYALSKGLFPKENWEDYEINHLNKSLSITDKIATYDKEDAAGTLTANKYLQYGDMFANAPKEEKDKMDSTQLASLNQKSGEAFKKAYDKNPADGLSAFNAGVIYYNVYGTYEDRYIANRRKLQELVANKPVEKDPKKKVAADAKFKEQTDAIKKLNSDIEKPMMDACDVSIDYLEKAYTVLNKKTDRTSAEKNCLSKSVDFLSNLYAIKRDKQKGKDPKMYDVYDAKYKFYDELHGKIK